MRCGNRERPSCEARLPIQRRGALLLVLAGAVAPALAAEPPLNDSGQIACYDAGAATGTVSSATPDPETPGFNEQDCTRGAAAADALGKLAKTGASSVPGRDYTKIANDGSELPASAEPGTEPGDWACTRDNATGLIWEIKTDDGGLRDSGHTYAWYDASGSANGGDAGFQSGGDCGGMPAQCNTSAYRDAVNGAGLCGAGDWRLPTGKELQSLIHYGAGTGPYIDSAWFPRTQPGLYWSGVNYASNNTAAWVVDFGQGNLYGDYKGDARYVRLVRNGQ